MNHEMQKPKRKELFLGQPFEDGPVQRGTRRSRGKIFHAASIAARRQSFGNKSDKMQAGNPRNFRDLSGGYRMMLTKDPKTRAKRRKSPPLTFLTKPRLRRRASTPPPPYLDARSTRRDAE
jgi:hypothetical protein